MPTSELLRYFTAEKQGAVLIAALGATSAIFAAYLWFTRSSFRAMAWPLVILGAGQMAVGTGLLLRTDSQVVRLEEGLRTDPRSTIDSELARMGKVHRLFKIVQAVEVVLLVAGIFLALAFRSRQLAWAAVGMGLTLQAAITLVLDLFAEHRALAYTRWLVGWSEKVGGA